MTGWVFFIFFNFSRIKTTSFCPFVLKSNPKPKASLLTLRLSHLIHAALTEESLSVKLCLSLDLPHLTHSLCLCLTHSLCPCLSQAQAFSGSPHALSLRCLHSRGLCALCTAAVSALSTLGVWVSTEQR